MRNGVTFSSGVVDTKRSVSYAITGGPGPTNPMPTVSVIIPAYNQAQYLSESIQSVLDQTFQDFEIIVVNDGSVDHTHQVVESFIDPRIHYIYQENRGLAAARNTGIRNSGGPYLTFLDADDLFLPEKLSLLVAELEVRSDLGLVAGQAIAIDELGRQIGKTFNTPLPEDPTLLLLNNPLHVGSVLLSQLWLERVGYFDEVLRAYEDWDLWLRLARSGCSMEYIPQPVSCYRFHRSQMTREPDRMRVASFAMLDKLFGDPNLPEHWRELRDQAYGNAYLRAAAQAYRTGFFESARSDLSEALELNPKLFLNGPDTITSQFFAWAADLRTGDPIQFLENVYQNLPDNLVSVRQQRRNVLAGVAVRYAFESYHGQEFTKVRCYLRRAIRYNPWWLKNRSVWSIYVRSWFR